MRRSLFVSLFLLFVSSSTWADSSIAEVSIEEPLSTNCACRVFPGNYPGVVLFHKSDWGTSGIKTYRLDVEQLTEEEIVKFVEVCRADLLQLTDAEVCQPLEAP